MNFAPLRSGAKEGDYNGDKNLKNANFVGSMRLIRWRSRGIEEWERE